MHGHRRAMNSIMNLLVLNTRGFLQENQSYQSQLNASVLCWLKENHPMFTLLLYIVAFRACMVGMRNVGKGERRASFRCCSILPRSF